MRKPKLLSNLWKLNSSDSILDNVAMRNDCSLESTLPFTTHAPCPMVPLCPKGTAQAKCGTENNSSLEMRSRLVSCAQCSNHKHKLMVCPLAMQRRCHEFESQRNGQQHLPCPPGCLRSLLLLILFKHKVICLKKNKMALKLKSPQRKPAVREKMP